MATERATPAGMEPVAILGSIIRDVGRLAGQHGDLLRRELRDGLNDSAAAAATVGAGAGLVAAGGLFGSLMLVHGLNRTTRIPLWGCYGLVGGLLATTGIGLIGAGSRRAANINFVPRETIAVLRDDLEWMTNRDETRTT